MKRWTWMVVALVLVGCGIFSPCEDTEVLCQGVEACDAVALAQLAGAECVITERVAKVGEVTFAVWVCELCDD
jgi:hypothetical protein